MKENLKKIIKCVCFIVVFILIFYYLDNVFEVKGQRDKKDKHIPWEYYNNGALYGYKGDSLDIAFIGASQTFTSVIPLEIWHETGITSAVLSSGNFSANETYYAIKELFKYQSPSIVFLDAYSLRFYKIGYQALSWLRPSYDKFMAMRSCEQARVGRNELLAMFDLLYNHGMWEHLGRSNFEDYRDRYAYAKGYFYTPQFTPINLNYRHTYNTHREYRIADQSKKALKDIYNLCKRNNCELILYKSPAFSWTKYDSYNVEKLCETLGIEFWDYTECEYVYSLGFDENLWFYDGGHLNYNGAHVISGEICKDLKLKRNIADKRSDHAYDQWNQDCLRQIVDKKAADFSVTDDLAEYLALAQASPYVALVSVKDDAGGNISEKELCLLDGLGFKKTPIGKSKASYLGISMGGKVYFEDESPTKELRHRCVIDETDIYVSSSADRSSIKINEKEYSLNSRGINIVLFDTDHREVIDSVAFNVGDSAQAVKRRIIPVGE